MNSHSLSPEECRRILKADREGGLETRNIQWLEFSFRYDDGSVITPGWVDRNVFTGIPDEHFDPKRKYK